MKKLISLLLMVSMVFSLASVPIVAFAGSTEFLVVQSFNDQTTGAVPEGAVASGNAKVVVTEEGREKAVELSASKSQSSILYTVSSDENTLSMFFDIEYKGSWSKTSLYVMDNSNKSFTIASIDEKGVIRSGDSRLSSVIPKNRKTPVQITYNKKYRKATIYVGEKCLTSNRYMGDTAPKTIGGYGINVTGKPDASCLVDNFAIFVGTPFIKSTSVPKASYSKEEIVISSAAAEEEEFVGDSVYVNRSFDEDDGRPEFENVRFTENGNKITIEQSVFDGNKYIKINKRGSKQGYIQYAGNKSARYVVAQADFSTEMYTPSSQLFYLRDEDAKSMFCPILDLKASTGQVVTKTGLYVCTIEPLKWVNIAVVLDSKELTYDVYVDRKLVHEAVPFTNQTITAIPLFRTNVNETTGTGTLLVDNLRTYEGKTIREFKEEGRKSVVKPTSVAVSLLGKMKAIEPFNNNLFVNGQKSKAAYDIIGEEDNTVIYAHETDLKTLFGENVKLTGPHPTKENYYNACETGNLNGYLLKNVDTRLFLFSNTPINLSDSELDEVRRHMFHDRPTKEQIWADFEKTSKDKHPRILINSDDIERLKYLYKTDPVMKKWGDMAIKTANSWFGKEEIVYASDPKDGYRNLEEINPFMSMMFAYHITGNERYIARAWKFMENLCKLPHWNEKVTFLDIGEISFIVGLGYDWLYPYITQEQRDYLAENLLNKGVELMRKVYFSELDPNQYYVTFYNATNNWGAVTNGGGMCGAMALLDVYPETCLDVIANANRCIEYMTGTFYPKGAWEEGVGYWNYALTYLNYTMMSLEKTFGSSYGLHNIPGLEKTGWYGSKLAGSTGMYTMGDASASFTNNREVMALATRYGDADLMATRLNEMEKYGHEPTLLEMIYYDPALNKGEAVTDLDSYMEGMETISLREAWFDKNATYVGASGGDNKRSHGHMDSGSFMIDMSGVRFISDVGGENYNATGGYFTTNRYRFYAARPEGHNLYIINPEEDNLDYYGQDSAKVKSELLVSKPKGAIAKMDLSSAYKSWTNSATRGIMLSDNRRSVTVRDEIDLKGDDNSIYWFLHTLTDVEYLEGNTAILNKNGRKMQITVNCDAPDWSLELVPSKTMSNVTSTIVKDTNKESQNYKTLAVKVKGASGKVNITAKFKQYDDLMIDPNPTELDISEWTIPDGEVTPLPVADMIYVDGKPIKDYNPVIGGYSNVVANKETRIPTITVSASNRYEINQSTEFGTDTIVKVYSPDNPEVYRTYLINFFKLPPLKDIDGMRRYPVAEVIPVDIPEPQNGPDKIIDQNFGTRWASEGDGKWIMLELDDVYPIEKVGISWMNGDTRVYTFKLEISEDGNKWTTIYNGSSKSGTTGLEYTEAGGKLAKYVRYTGYGNSVNKFNSITEIAALGNQR